MQVAAAVVGKTCPTSSRRDRCRRGRNLGDALHAFPERGVGTARRSSRGVLGVERRSQRRDVVLHLRRKRRRLHQVLVGVPSLLTISAKDLYNIVEKAVIMSRAAGQTESTQGFNSLITNYAEMLSSQGDLDSALDYLGMVPAIEARELTAFANRIIRSGLSNTASTRSPAPATPAAVASPTPAPAYGAQSSPYGESPYQDDVARHQGACRALPGAWSASTRAVGVRCASGSRTSADDVHAGARRAASRAAASAAAADRDGAAGDRPSRICNRDTFPAHRLSRRTPR